MSQNFLDPCTVPSQTAPIADPPPPYCPEPCADPSLRKVQGVDLGWNKGPCDGGMDGASALCDPMQAGHLVNDLENPSRETIYRYSRGFRGNDEGMRDLFSDVIVLDPDGKAFPVPIVWASRERAVAAILQDNVRQDSTVVDRIRLPMMAIYANGYAFDQNRYIYHQARQYFSDFRAEGTPMPLHTRAPGSRTIFGVARGLPYNISYTLYVWTMFLEDMNQILEQVTMKFSPMAYIRVRGVGLEIGVKLDSIANNLNVEPGDKDLRVVKFEFNMTAETFIPQPIARRQAVLKTRTEVLDGLTQEDAIAVLSRFEESAKEPNVRD